MGISTQVMDKSEIEKTLAAGYSLRKTAKLLGVSLAKLYYYIEKYQISTRSKSEAQAAFIKRSGHQRAGSSHSSQTKDKISTKMAEFWDGSQGEAQKERIVKQRREEWNSKDRKDKAIKINQLKNALRPKAGKLSKLGVYLAEFLKTKQINILTCEKLVLNHSSDIVLVEQKLVVELIPPIYVFGQEAEEKLFQTYNKIKEGLDKLGYKLLIIEQISNSLSQSRCKKIMIEIEEMIKNNIKYKVIQS